MSGGHPDIVWSRQLGRTSPGQVALWTVAALAVLSAHAGAAWWVLRERPLPAMDDAAPAIMVELASVAMAPAAQAEQVAADEVDAMEATPVEAVDRAEPVDEAEPVEVVDRVEPVEPVTETAEAVEPDPVEPEPVEAEITEAEPVDIALADMPVDPLLPEEIAPVESAAVAAVRAEMIEPEETVEPLPEVAIPVPQKRLEPPVREARQEKPKEQPKKEPPPRRQEASSQKVRAQVQATQPAPRAAAPQASAGAGASVSPARWQSRVMAHLERRKRYPASARRQRQEGTAQVRFTIDANGNVGSVALSRSSGVAELDAEVVALVRRASPIPAPPPGVNRTIVVPIRFNLR